MLAAKPTDRSKQRYIEPPPGEASERPVRLVAGGIVFRPTEDFLLRKANEESAYSGTNGLISETKEAKTEEIEGQSVVEEVPASNPEGFNNKKNIQQLLPSDVDILFTTSRREEKDAILPKGGWDEGETCIEAAIREVMEEAGVVCVPPLFAPQGGDYGPEVGHYAPVINRLVRNKKGTSLNHIYYFVLQFVREADSFLESGERMVTWQRADRVLSKQTGLSVREEHVGYVAEALEAGCLKYCGF